MKTKKEQIYDVVIVGAGVTGCSIARSLSRYDLKLLVIDKEEDVCSGTSKANSAIIHAGFDAENGTLKAKLNVKGAKMLPSLSKQLDFPYKQNGSMVLCFRKEDEPGLRELYERGLKNGVEDMELISGDEILVGGIVHPVESHRQIDIDNKFIAFETCAAYFKLGRIPD